MEKAIDRLKFMLDYLWPTSHSSQTHVSFFSASICLAGDIVTCHRTTTFGDDVITVAAYCSAICKEKHGAFIDTLPGDLLGPVMKALIEKTNLNREVGNGGTVFMLV